MKGQEHIKNDERILWESDFVADVLFQANEKFEPKYELKSVGYDLGGVGARAAEICEKEVDDIFLKNKQEKKVKSRNLFYFWPACAGTADRAFHELVSVFPGLGTQWREAR